MFVSSSIRHPPGREAAYSDDFGPFEGRIWLNTAHQGPIPRVAAEAARTALAKKVRPYLIGDDDFFQVPVRLRAALGNLIGANPDDIILGNSTTYGLDLLANGLRWQAGDEILLVDGDFPANVFPWSILRDKGVTVRFFKSPAPRLDPQQLAHEISPRTRLFCVSWVNTFNGYAIDMNAMARVCEANEVIFVVNASQALGAKVIDVGTAPISALTCTGSKWLCGPYGTGFCWVDPSLRDTLKIQHSYWLTMLAGRPIDKILDYSLRNDLGARAWDVFCTANLFNFMPWTASLEYMLQVGVANIAAHDERLVARLLEGLDQDRFQLISPATGPERSAIVILQLSPQEDMNTWSQYLTNEGLDVAFGGNSIRISPHLHNSYDDISKMLQCLADLQ
jgi:cysteine desulfurase/selenocysteine lyase